MCLPQEMGQQGRQNFPQKHFYDCKTCSEFTLRFTHWTWRSPPNLKPPGFILKSNANFIPKFCCVPPVSSQGFWWKKIGISTQKISASPGGRCTEHSKWKNVLFALFAIWSLGYHQCLNFGPGKNSGFWREFWWISVKNRFASFFSRIFHSHFKQASRTFPGVFRIWPTFLQTEFSLLVIVPGQLFPLCKSRHHLDSMNLP